ncbi:MAG: efflux transporter outer membrane subunit [Pseudomonadota bacterium]
MNFVNASSRIVFVMALLIRWMRSIFIRTLYIVQQIAVKIQKQTWNVHRKAVSSDYTLRASTGQSTIDTLFIPLPQFALIAATVLLSACTAVGPDYVTPKAPVAEDWQSITDKPDALVSSKSDEGSDSQWWTAFNDPVLNELVKLARGQNLTLQVAGLRVLEARAELGIAVGNLYPQSQTARGGVSQFEVSENQANFTPGQLDTSYREADLGFDVAWELDFWGRFRRAIEAADASLLSEVAGYDDVLVTLAADVATTYVLIRTFEERLRLAQSNVDIQARSLQIAEVRFRNDLTTELDVQQARSLLANTQATLPSLELGLRQTQHALSVLLGLPPSDLAVYLTRGPMAIPAAPDQLALGMPADLLRRRPDIRQAERLAAAQSAAIGLTTADLYPAFSLTGSVGLRAADTPGSSLSDLFDSGSLEASYGPSFSWNILNYGRIKNAVRAEDALFQQAVLSYQETVLRAAQEVEDAVVSFTRNRERVGFLSTSVMAAERSVELALVQYRDGTADYTRVLDTQESLVTQQDSFTEARGDVVSSLIDAYRALGGGWQTYPQAGFISDKLRETMTERTDWGDLLEPDATTPPPGSQIRAPDW